MFCIYIFINTTKYNIIIIICDILYLLFFFHSNFTIFHRTVTSTVCLRVRLMRSHAVLQKLTAELSTAMSNELNGSIGHCHCVAHAIRLVGWLKHVTSSSPFFLAHVSVVPKSDCASGVGTVKHRSTQTRAARGVAQYVIMQRGEHRLRP